ncbi:MAG: hypothetical protein NC124_19150, partial [Clostridium sp.]|nr:hypothetical protein [Clostridium sp.]
ITNYMTTAAAVQFSDEYKFDVSAETYVSFIQKYGKIITPDETIWTKIDTRNREKYPLTNLLLALGFLLFLADIAMRRFQYVPSLKWLRLFRLRGRNIPDSPLTEHSVEKDSTASKNASEDKTLAAPSKKKSKKSAKTAAAQTLDTSFLLKKKDDRNQGE